MKLHREATKPSQFGQPDSTKNWMSPAEAQSKLSRREKRLHDEPIITNAVNKVRNSVSRKRFCAEDPLHIGSSVLAIVGRGAVREKAQATIQHDKQPRKGKHVALFPTVPAEAYHKFRVARVVAAASLVASIGIAKGFGYTPADYPGVSGARVSISERTAPDDYTLVPSEQLAELLSTYNGTAQNPSETTGQPPASSGQETPPPLTNIPDVVSPGE